MSGTTPPRLPIDRLLPLAAQLPPIDCETCGTILTPVPPALLVYRCPTCNPQTLLRTRT